MKYVPNLIPEHSRIKFDDDFQKIEAKKKSSSFINILSSIGASIFFISSLATIFTRFWEGSLFLAIAVILLPQGHKWIEKAGRFKLTWLIKTCMFLLLYIPASFLSIEYNERENEIARLEKIKQDKKTEEARLATLRAEKIERSRKDSLNYYISKADNAVKVNKMAAAILLTNSALNFAGSESNILVHKRASIQLKAKQYKDAITDYTTLISSGHSLNDTYFERALYFNKLNKKQEAVNDLKRAIELGNKDAEKLHEKINPLKRRVTYYVTRCCDGTTSSAKGRGACSHHDGVCNWNDPVYEEYRQY